MKVTLIIKFPNSSLIFVGPDIIEYIEIYYGNQNTFIFSIIKNINKSINYFVSYGMVFIHIF